jgi:PPM family protein phosphatase
MALEIVNISDVGRKRPHNEDSTATDIHHGLAILADGMGGYKAGEVASALAVITVLKDITDGLKNGYSAAGAKSSGISFAACLVREAINHANSNIYSMAKANAECRGMGTTIVTGLIRGNKISIGNVGDSRMYRYRTGGLQQITKDHSLIQELIDRGMYSPEEANAKMPKNLVTRALGLDKDVEVDIIEEDVNPADIYLLCSDGLNDMVNDEEIHLTLSKYSANLVQTAEQLVQLANSKGGKDNISVVLVRSTDEGSALTAGGYIKKTLKRFL